MESCGLYVHIPFCKSKCHYCDFPSYPNLEEYIPSYIDALIKEIAMAAKRYPNYRIQSIFIGGGTPTYINGNDIVAIMDAVRGCFPIGEDIEVSIEANPGTFDGDKLIQLRDAGVNRLSIGLQAWQNHLLKDLGRIHTQQDFIEGFHAARKAGFYNINIDLILGLPNQRFKDWEETLDRVLELEPTHLSCYSLIIEEVTPFYRLWESGKLELDEDLEREMYHYTRDILKAKGYLQYEISNFSKPGFQCQHNLIYWELKPYIGVGSSAHSFINGYRYANVDSIIEYIQEVEGNKVPIKEETKVNQKELMEEFMFLGLRKTRGVSRTDFFNYFAMDIFDIYGIVLEELEGQDLIRINHHIALTEKGLDFANLVYQSFLLP